MKKLHGLRKRWYMLRDLLGISSKKYSYKNGYGLIDGLGGHYKLVLKKVNPLQTLFDRLKTSKTIVNNSEIMFLTGVNAMCGVTENSLRFLIEYLRKTQSNKLLSVGCGLLDQVKILETAGFDVYGVDIDIANDTDRLKFHDLNQYNDLPFDEQKFDFVLCQEVIEHIENPWLLFRKIKRVLKKDGIIVLTTPNILSRNSRQYFMNSAVGFFESFNEESIWQHINPLPFWEIMHIANYNDFELLKLSNNMEYYFDYDVEKDAKITQQDLTLDSGHVLHYIFKNKNNDVKPYIPNSTYQYSLDMTKKQM